MSWRGSSVTGNVATGNAIGGGDGHADEDLPRQARTFSGGLSHDAVRALLESFAGDVERALQRCGVTVLPVEPGERHRAVKAEAVDNANLDATVAAVVEDGDVEAGSGKVIAPVKVAVNRFSEREEANTDG
jgi:hypothetical protein